MLFCLIWRSNIEFGCCVPYILLLLVFQLLNSFLRVVLSYLRLLISFTHIPRFDVIVLFFFCNTVSVRRDYRQLYRIFCTFHQPILMLDLLQFATKIDVTLNLSIILIQLSFFPSLAA